MAMNYVSQQGSNWTMLIYYNIIFTIKKFIPNLLILGMETTDKGLIDLF